MTRGMYGHNVNIYLMKKTNVFKKLKG